MTWGPRSPSLPLSPTSPFTSDMVAQALELSRKPHVVIATPGRLADHLRSSNTFNMKKIRFLVSQLGPPGVLGPETGLGSTLCQFSLLCVSV